MRTPRPLALKIAKLPDRTPVKVTIALLPALHADLVAYLQLYEEVHGVAEQLPVLIPHILDSFLSSDRDFVRWRKRASEVHEEVS
ncbi:MAG: DUF2274 domain-containing protein [Micropepsaceae bacterium]